MGFSKGRGEYLTKLMPSLQLRNHDLFLGADIVCSQLPCRHRFAAVDQEIDRLAVIVFLSSAHVASRDLDDLRFVSMEAIQRFALMGAPRNRSSKSSESPAHPRRKSLGTIYPQPKTG